ncbi:MAG: RNA methyltransferase [Flavobacterium sp.]|nr:MAG: RNA methyltransferase [Flavobacterium sp.]
MVSKSQIKLIGSLQQKKFRMANGLFIAEGVKIIGELIGAGFVLDHLYLTDDLFRQVPQAKKTLISESELKKISALTTANNCLAVFEIPSEKPIDQKGLLVALDDIRDPGNLGTIVRLCDWFGITQLVCSNETADLYNPKVVQATMGSMARVNVSYVDLPDFLSKANLPVFGTFMDGKNIYSEKLPSDGIIVLGNEANGISSSVEKFCTERIAIPRFGNLQLTESLNVATAAAIVLSEFRR